MRKRLLFMATLSFVLALSACTTADSNDLTDLAMPATLTSSESLSTLAYLSGSMLDIDNADSTVSTNLFMLSDTDETEIETELDTVTEYMDQLQEFMDNGTASFGSVVQEVSDNPNYAFMVTFVVNGETYFIYYNTDTLTLEISGIMLIGEVEYIIEVSNTLADNESLESHDNDDLDHEDDDDADNYLEEDVLDEESGATVDSETDTEEIDDTTNTEDEDHDEDIDNEEQMVLTAYNGDDFVKVVYKVETSDEETETKFTLTSNIANVEREVFMKISIEENEYKVSIEEDGNEYTFKREIEDGETTYKLEYDVNGVEGEVKIIETVNDLGKIVYEYQIKEGDKSSTVEIEEPDHHSDEHEDENEDEEETDANEA